MKKNTATAARELAEPLAQSLGYSLWDVEFAREGSEYILRYTLDKPEGINIDDCEKFHRAIDPMLDDADLIATSYRLEVSSPGIERELKNDSHLDFCQGEKVEAKLFRQSDAGRVITGILTGHDDESITLKTDAGEIKLARKDISVLKTVFDFEDI